MKVSNSRINLWRNCHYAHYLRYVLKLAKKMKGGPLRRGSAIHECLEAYNSGKSWKKPLDSFAKEFYEKTFAEERIEMGDLPVMVRELLENYIVFYEEEDEDVEFLVNELHFELPLPGLSDIYIEGYIDAITKNGKGEIWPREYKSYARMPDRDFLIFNNQSAIYIWALSELGYKPMGMLWDIIKAKEPTKPKITQKTKKLSVAKLDSTPYSVTKGIRELDLDPEDYQEFINKHSYNDYFVRHQIRLNKSVVESIMEDTATTALEIAEKGETLKDRNLSKSCSWCDYKEICQAEILGLDTEYIIKSLYGPRGGRDEEEKDQKVNKKRKPNRK